MESRLFDLILNEDASYLERATGDTWTPPVASLASGAAPGFRSHKHDCQAEFGPELIDPRLFEQQKTTELCIHPFVGSIPAEEILQTIPSVGPHGSSSINRHRRYNYGNDKSAAPLAGVLNKSPLQVSDDLFGVESRKRKRPETENSRILPTPPGSDNRPGKRHVSRPFLPPLLAPLHEPPPNARVVPSISDNAFGRVQAETSPLQGKVSLKGEGTPVDIVSSTAHKKCRSPSSAINQAPQTAGVKSKKNRWTEQETKDLLLGVARFGIGSWKKILSHPDFNFDRRTAVDLKDRFRTCSRAANKGPTSSNEIISQSPDDAFKSDAHLTSSAATSQAPPITERASGARSKDNERLLALGMSTSFPKRHRRERRQFTKEEDEALMKGFHKHQAQWKKIQQDAEFNLSSRSRTDLRDRFRNRYPEIFTELGYKGRFQPDKRTTHHDSQSTQDEQPFVVEGDIPQCRTGNPPCDQSEVADSITLVSSRSSFAALPSRLNVMRLLPTAAFECVNFSPSGPNSTDEDPSAITLSRNIFRWAAQHQKSSAPTLNAPKTLSRLDQFHINPLLTLKGSLTSTSDSSTFDPLSFPLPALPLAGILNGPVSLPPPSELVSSFETERKDI